MKRKALELKMSKQNIKGIMSISFWIQSP